jgi:uncharacterized membrane protein YdjX (TVP38/TMEM64 family)
MTANPNRRGWIKPVVFIVLLVGLILLARSLALGGRIDDLRAWIEALGFWGPFVFLLLYTAAVVAAVPGSALTVVAGALFGSVLGVIVVIHAATLGAGLCFLIARYFARDTVSSWLSRSDTFRRLDDLTEQRGAVIVALTRLVPIFPFNVLNYGFGLTRVPFWTYLLWSWLCMLPGTVLYVVGADALTTGLAEGKVPWGLVATVAAVVVLIVLLIPFARRRLQSH